MGAKSLPPPYNDVTVECIARATYLEVIYTGPPIQLIASGAADPVMIKMDGDPKPSGPLHHTCQPLTNGQVKIRRMIFDEELARRLPGVFEEPRRRLPSVLTVKPWVQSNHAPSPATEFKPEALPDQNKVRETAQRPKRSLEDKTHIDKISASEISSEQSTPSVRIAEIEHERALYRNVVVRVSATLVADGASNPDGIAKHAAEIAVASVFESRKAAQRLWPDNTNKSD